jgi:uncharacterized protein (TIGR00251 family)
MFRDTPAGAEIDIRVIPRAHKTEIAGERDGALLVRVKAPPVDGAANDAVVECLAAALGVPRRAIAIVAGERSRRKKVVVAAMSAAAVRERLGLSAI